jgi:hypothetical protein
MHVGGVYNHSALEEMFNRSANAVFEPTPVATLA